MCALKKNTQVYFNTERRKTQMTKYKERKEQNKWQKRQ